MTKRHTSGASLCQRRPTERMCTDAFDSCFPTRSSQRFVHSRSPQMLSHVPRCRKDPIVFFVFPPIGCWPLGLPLLQCLRQLRRNGNLSSSHLLLGDETWEDQRVWHYVFPPQGKAFGDPAGCETTHGEHSCEFRTTTSDYLIQLFRRQCGRLSRSICLHHSFS